MPNERRAENLRDLIEGKPKLHIVLPRSVASAVVEHDGWERTATCGQGRITSPLEEVAELRASLPSPGGEASRPATSAVLVCRLCLCHHSAKFVPRVL